VDVVRLHNYYQTWIDEPAERIVDYIQRVADIIDQYGSGQPICVAEGGYSSYRHRQRRGGFYEPYYEYERTPEFQATHVVCTMASLLSTGRLECLAWYEVRDLIPDARAVGEGISPKFLTVVDSIWRTSHGLR
jgi:hypothetical protein